MNIGKVSNSATRASALIEAQVANIAEAESRLALSKALLDAPLAPKATGSGDRRSDAFSAKWTSFAEALGKQLADARADLERLGSTEAIEAEISANRSARLTLSAIIAEPSERGAFAPEINRAIWITNAASWSSRIAPKFASPELSEAIRVIAEPHARALAGLKASLRGLLYEARPLEPMLHAPPGWPPFEGRSMPVYLRHLATLIEKGKHWDLALKRGQLGETDVPLDKESAGRLADELRKLADGTDPKVPAKKKSYAADPGRLALSWRGSLGAFMASLEAARHAAQALPDR